MRVLNGNDWDTYQNDKSSLTNRIADAETSVGTLASRMTTAEGTLSGHATRVGALETWRSAKASAIPDNTATPGGGVVDVLGIQVATGASITSMQTSFGSLKGTVNAILAALRSRDIVAA